MNKKKCTKTISLRHVVSLISFWQQTTSLICRVRTVCIWVISIVFCSVCVCVFIWRRKMKCLRLEKAAHSICSTFVYNTNYYYSAFHIIVFIIVNSIIMWMSLECLSDIHMLNIQRAKIISRSSSSSFSQMWQFFQRAGKRVQLQTLLFSVPYTHPKNKFNANNVNNLCGCVWCVGKFIAEQDVEKERERRKSGKSFKNIISWLLLFRVKNNFLTDFALPCLVNAGKNMNEDFLLTYFLLDFVETTTTSEWKKNEEDGEKKFEFDTICTTARAHEILKGQFTFSSCKQQMLSLSFLFLASIHPLYFFFFVVVGLCIPHPKCWRRKSFTLENPTDWPTKPFKSPEKNPQNNPSHQFLTSNNSIHSLLQFPFFILSLLQLGFRWRQQLWNCEIEKQRQRHREMLMFSIAFP